MMINKALGQVQMARACVVEIDPQTQSKDSRPLCLCEELLHQHSADASAPMVRRDRDHNLWDIAGDKAGRAFLTPHESAPSRPYRHTTNLGDDTTITGAITEVADILVTRILLAPGREVWASVLGIPLPGVEEHTRHELEVRGRGFAQDRLIAREF
jgi:hypothetical protein